MAPEKDTITDETTKPQVDDESGAEPETATDQEVCAEPRVDMQAYRRRVADQIKAVARINNRELTEKENDFLGHVACCELLGEPH